ncbi:MAG: DNA-binding protein [Bacteroidales bacterium]
MSDKKPFVLRINPRKLRAVEKWAADEFRSTNGQIEYIIDQALRRSGRWTSRTVEEGEAGDDEKGINQEEEKAAD